MAGHAEVIRTVYAYSAWANDRLLAAATPLSPERFVAAGAGGFGSIRDTLVHTMSSQRTWLARCQGEEPGPSLDPTAFPDVAAIRVAWAALDQEMEQFVAGLDDDDLVRVVAYRTSTGERYAHPVWQMLLHQANHAMQHRSEVAMALTAAGHSPGWLDLIVFLRERSGPLP